MMSNNYWSRVLKVETLTLLIGRRALGAVEDGFSSLKTDFRILIPNFPDFLSSLTRTVAADRFVPQPLCGDGRRLVLLRT